MSRRAKIVPVTCAREHPIPYAGAFCDACLTEACAFDRANLTDILTLQVLDTNEIVSFRVGRPRRRRKPL